MYFIRDYIKCLHISKYKGFKMVEKDSTLSNRVKGSFRAELKYRVGLGWIIVYNIPTCDCQRTSRPCTSCELDLDCA